MKNAGTLKKYLSLPDRKYPGPVISWNIQGSPLWKKSRVHAERTSGFYGTVVIFG